MNTPKKVKRLQYKRRWIAARRKLDKTIAVSNSRLEVEASCTINVAMAKGLVFWSTVNLMF